MSDFADRNRSDSVLIEVIARELDRLAADEAAYGPLGMMSQLLRTVGDDNVNLSPAPDRSMDEYQLRAYLAANNVIGPDDRIELMRSALGFSKDTYMIRVEPATLEAYTLVIRRNQPAGTTRTTVLDEFPLLNDLYRLGYPVAEPLLLEPDPTMLGQPFMLSRGVQGEPDFVDSNADADQCEQAARDLAGFLARLHNQDLNEVSMRRLSPGGNAVQELAAYFDEWRGFWEESAPSEYPHVQEVFERVLPDYADIDRVCLVHSDVGFHNILVDNGHISAVVDWEFAHLGEPEEDLSYCRASVEKLVSWDRFIEFYVQAGGTEPSADRLRAYDLWRNLRNAICCALGRQAFDQGLNNDLRVAYAGRIILAASVEGLKQPRE